MIANKVTDHLLEVIHIPPEAQRLYHGSLWIFMKEAPEDMFRFNYSSEGIPKLVGRDPHVGFLGFPRVRNILAEKRKYSRYGSASNKIW